MNDANPERVRSALSHLDPNDRKVWVRQAMAIKSEFGESGFDLWDEWGTQSESHKASDAKSVWRSVKPNGRTTIASLFWDAKQAGWKDDSTYKKPSAEEIAKRRALRAQRDAEAAAHEEAQHWAVAEQALAIWEAAKPCDDHLYLIRKAVKSYGLRFGDFPVERVDPNTGEVTVAIMQALLVPLVDRSRKIWSVQAIIGREGRPKLLLKHGRKSGNFFVIGKPQVIDGRRVFVLVEGYATGASVHEATGQMVLVCIDASNLRNVARQLRERDPASIIVVGADNDLWGRRADGTPYNPGMEAAALVAKESCALVVAPPFCENDATGKDAKGRADGPKDWNDWHRINGAKSLTECFETAVAQVPKVVLSPVMGLKEGAIDGGITPPKQASLPVAQVGDGVQCEDRSRLRAEVGIIPIGGHGGDLVFWRCDFKRVVFVPPKALGSHQGLQRLARTQNWEAWWGGKDFKPQFASDVLINYSAGLGDVDLARVPVDEAGPNAVREAFLRAKVASSVTGPAPVVLAELLALAPEWNNVVFFDEFAARVTCNELPPCGGLPGQLTDMHDDMLAAYLSSKYGINVSSKVAHDTVNLLASHNRRHPLREYLKSLTWDGTPRLDRWLIDHAGAKDDGFVRAVSAKILIAAVERAHIPGSKVDTALVLEGPQGVKKSTLLRALVPDTSWFAEDLAGAIGGKDALQGLNGKWIIELSEIAAIKKGTVEDVKAFLTRRVDSYRSPYGRRVADHPRQCVFVGSVNPSADGSWLHDTTGGRRFWPVGVTKADVEGLAQARDQLWAEAVHRHKAGEPHWLSEDEEEIAAEEQKARLQENPWEFAVADFLRSHTCSSEPIATAEIFDFAQKRKPTKKDSPELASIAEALLARGFVKKQHGQTRTIRWFQTGSSSVGQPAESTKPKR